MFGKFNPLFQLFVALSIAVGISLTGCEKSDEGTSAVDQGKLTIKITDSPFPVKWIEEANVTITKIDMRRADSIDGSPFITVWEGRKTVNLLALRNGETEDLPEAEVPAGTYNLIRIRVDSASVKYKNGAVMTLKVPSGARTGIKIFIDPPLEVEGGQLSEILLDFDVSKSFMVRGKWHQNFPGFIFRPVIRAVFLRKAGSIIGLVSDTTGTALEDAQIQVEQDTVVTHAFTNHRGFYKILGLREGTYKVTAIKENYQQQEAFNVNVTKGQATIQNFTLIPAE
ncbi:MAG: DUF4382 domain-containing protein [Calditrichaeota bacterium]|nr:DUF4382 domain-containing protein [Calditrichota bacterium]